MTDQKAKAGAPAPAGAPAQVPDAPPPAVAAVVVAASPPQPQGVGGGGLGPLPPGFSVIIDQASGNPVYLNHMTKVTSWDDPRIAATPYAQHTPILNPAAAGETTEPCFPVWEVQQGGMAWIQLSPAQENAAEDAFRTRATGRLTVAGGPQRWEVEADHGWFQLDGPTNAAILKGFAENKSVVNIG